MKSENPLPLQKIFKSLALATKDEKDEEPAEKVLLGKLVSSRVFSKFTVARIASTVWRNCARLKVEKIGDKVFKFMFNSKGDRDRVFSKRPWSFNGSHLILKLWEAERPIIEIDFNTSTLILQIHDLPLNMLKKENALLISNKVGLVHESNINIRIVVKNRFLKVRLDIPINTPLPTNFFHNREKGEPF